VDVGAWDGRHLSNTFSLLCGQQQRGAVNCGVNRNNEVDNSSNNSTNWSGVLIEADGQKFQELQSLYNQSDNICIHATVSCEAHSQNSLINILSKHNTLPRDFDFLCIDVDGIDYWLMHNILGGDVIHDDNTTNHIDPVQNIADQHHLNQQQPVHNQYYRPDVICIEFNPSMPNELIYIPPRSDSTRHGSSLSALVELATCHDYVLIETTVFNAFFVRRHLYQSYFKKEVPNTSIEVLHEVSMGTTLYQLYDGTLKLYGCKKMLWHKRPLEEEKMQMLALDEREFPFAPSAEDCTPDTEDGLDLEIQEVAVDMSSYCNPHTATRYNADDLDNAKQQCFTKLNHALQADGFVLVKGTNISPDTCTKALHVAKLFLHEADESVRRSCLTKDRARRGYSPMCTENFASLIGEKGVPNDLVKKFRVGPEEGNDYLEHSTTMASLSSLRQPNAWSSEDIWDHSLDFRVVIEEYYEQLRVAADCILRAICDGIVRENQSLEESMRVIAKSKDKIEEAMGETTTANHTSILTLLGYQPGSRHKRGSKGYLNPLVAAHTDVGMITVLLYDEGKCASLQRSASPRQGEQNQEWIDVNLPSPKYLKNGNDPVFVVNVGDCLSDLSGGYLRSTLHRVIPRPISSKDGTNLVRTSLALFVGLEEKAKLVLPSNEIMSYEEWRKRRIGRALEVIKN